MKKMLFLYNPISGRGEIRHSLASVLEKFSAAGYDLTVYPTKAAGDAVKTVRHRAGEFDIIVCSGGDGTLDEVVTGMMQSGVKRLIGYVPSGSTNDFGNSIGIPNHKEQAAELILSGEPFLCDLGRFNKQDYFVYIAAFGLMTDVSYETDQELKNMFGHAAYLIEGVKRLGNIKSYEMEIESEEFSEKGSYVFGMVTNSDSVAGFKGLPGPDIELNDGLFEVMLVRTPQDLAHWQQAISALIVNDESNESVVRFKTSRITFHSEEPVAWTRDGENGGEHTDVVLENMPDVIEFMTSPQAPEKELTEGKEIPLIPEQASGEETEAEASGEETEAEASGEETEAETPGEETEAEVSGEKTITEASGRKTGKKRRKHVMEKKKFGTLADGTEVSLYSFTNDNNMTMVVSDLGAILVSLLVPDKDGHPVDVVLGYDTPQEYLNGGCYFGAVIGRSGNRIDKGRFTIDGKEYQLPINDNENNLHSGPNGFETRMWEVADVDEEKRSITFHLVSPDGDNGYPGCFDVQLTYTLTDEDAVVLHYMGRSDADTIANMTNHSYFNLAGHASGSIEDHVLQLNADYYTPVRDEQAIPTGEIAPVADTPMDFTEAKPIRRDIDADFEQLKYAGGYDHNYILPDVGGSFQKIAEVTCKESGIRMDVVTDAPAVQLYVGNFITDQKGKGGVTYHKRQGLCLETQYAPNAINEPAFASPLLKAGEVYETETRYRFYTKKMDEDF